MRMLGLTLLMLMVGTTPVFANPDVGAGSNSFDTWATSKKQEPVVPPTREGAEPSSSKPAAAEVKYVYRTACEGGIGQAATGAPVCPVNDCPPGEGQYRLYRITAGQETPMGLVCTGEGTPPAVPAAAAPPQVTEAMILRAFRRIPLPALRSQSQPKDKTLINFDTIFFTKAEPLTRQLTLLGQRVRLEITPSRFEWVHGDGTTATTTTPGAPYPAKDIVHRYADAHRTVAHRVVVTWSAEYSLNGGALQPVNGTVTTTGPATPLRVAEASPALSGSGH
jgi:hypothetical protein